MKISIVDQDEVLLDESLFPPAESLLPGVVLNLMSRLPDASVPGAFGPAMWSVAPGSVNRQIVISILSLPADGGLSITALERSVNGGAWQSLGSGDVGAYPVLMAAAGTSYSIAVRARNALGPGAASATKAVTSAAAPAQLSGPTISPASVLVGQEVTVTPGSYQHATDFTGSLRIDGQTILTRDTTEPFAYVAQSAGALTWVEAASNSVGSVSGNASATVAYDADAAALFARMSVQPPAARKALINDRIIAAKASAWWAKLDFMFGMISQHTMQAGYLDWKRNVSAVPVGPVVFTADRGVATNGASSYLDLQLNPATTGQKMAQNSASFGFRLNTNRGVNISLAGFISGGGIFINPRNDQNRMQTYVNSTTVIQSGGNTSLDSIGMWATSRTGATATTLYKNGAVGTSGTGASQAMVSGSLRLGSTSDTSFREGEFAMAFGGQGLTDADLLDIFNWWEPIRLDLGIT